MTDTNAFEDYVNGLVAMEEESDEDFESEAEYLARTDWHGVNEFGS